MTAESSPPPRTPIPAPVRHWVAAIIVIFTLMGFAMASWLSRLPAVRDHIGASTLEMSIFGFCLSIGSVIGLVLAGRLVTRVGPKRAIAVTGATLSVAMPLAAWALWQGHTITGIILLFVFGFMFSTADVAMNVSGAGAERAEFRTRMPIFHGGFSLGGVAAMGLGAAAEAANVPVPIHLAVVFTCVFIGSFVCARYIPHDPFGATLLAKLGRGPLESVEIATSRSTTPAAESAASTGQAAIHRKKYRSSWRDPRIILIGLIMLTMSLAEGSGADWIPLALVDGRGFDNTSATLTLGAFFVSMTIIRLFGAPLLDRFGRVTVLRAGGALAVLGIVAVILIDSPWAGVLGAIAWGVGVAFGFPVGMSAAADNPDTAIRDVAAVSAIAYTAFLMGPILIGFLGQHLGLLQAFWPLVAAAAIAAFLAPAARELRLK